MVASVVVLSVLGLEAVVAAGLAPSIPILKRYERGVPFRLGKVQGGGGPDHPAVAAPPNGKPSPA